MVLNDKFTGLFEITKENLRVNHKGELSNKGYESIFGEENPYIICDVPKSKIKMITQRHDSIAKAYNELHNIQHVVLSTLKDEYLLGSTNFESGEGLENSSSESGIHFKISMNCDEVYHKVMHQFLKHKDFFINAYSLNSIQLKKDSDGNIEHLDFGFLNENPLFFNGISLEDLEIVHMFFVLFSEVEVDGPLIESLEVFLDSLHNVPYRYKKERQSDLHVNQVKKNHDTDYVNKFPLDLKGYDGLELSTKILLQSAIKSGKYYRILDRNENFVELANSDRSVVEYVKQATKTSLDNYSSVLLMENKAVTKIVLSQHSISVPKGLILTEDNQEYEFDKLYKKLVVKPNNTNFGLGISIFNKGYTQVDLDNAIDLAFSYDKTILLEEFIHGKEYRFLVIDSKVVAVLHREAANVIGDGHNSIKDLVGIKNQNPLRGKGYQTPLEIIELDSVVEDYLIRQSLSLDSVPHKNEKIYLRENSNISTGGDSIDCTELIHPSYFDRAIAAVNVLGVNISGVDMLIENIDLEAQPHNHSIIELNFNPAIHIHCFPLVGKRRNIGDLIINALFLPK